MKILHFYAFLASTSERVGLTWAKWALAVLAKAGESSPGTPCGCRIDSSVIPVPGPRDGQRLFLELEVVKVVKVVKCEFGEAGEELAGACRAWASIFSSFAMDFFLVPSESKAVAVKGVGVERRPPPPTSAVAAASHRQSRHTPWAPWAPWASIQPVQPQWLSRRLQKP